MPAVCDKCSQEVPPNNDVAELEKITGPLSEGILNWGGNNDNHRHLLPVRVRGQVVCEGSPSRAQYLEGQPRDTRSYGYREGLETLIREAYAKMQGG